MRIVFLVLLSIFVLAGVFLGGAGAWSVTAGPMSARVAKLTEAAAAAKEIGKMTKDQPIVAGKSAADASAALEQGLRGYRFTQFGGAAIALVNILLLVFAIRRRSQQILVVGGMGLVLGIASFVITPGREIDDTLHTFNVVLAISVIAAALFAFLAGRPKAAPALR